MSHREANEPTRGRLPGNTDDGVGRVPIPFEALTALAELGQRKGKVVEMRFFGGLSAEVLKVLEGTVIRDWRLAKVWLLRELSGGRSGEG